MHIGAGGKAIQFNQVTDEQSNATMKYELRHMLTFNSGLTVCVSVSLSFSLSLAASTQAATAVYFVYCMNDVYTVSNVSPCKW